MTLRYPRGVPSAFPEPPAARCAAPAFALICVCSWTGVADGEPRSLQELAESTRSAVVHLRLFDGSEHEFGSGSGFFVSADGRIMTNHHVVEGAHRVVAKLHDGRSVPIVGVLAMDAQADIVVLKAEGRGYSTLELGRAEQARVGDEVVVIGSPAGFSGTVSAGIISAVRKNGPDGDLAGVPPHAKSWVLQVTAPVSPGSSGSPILDRDGRVIGMAVGIFTGGQALNFGVPVERMANLLAKLPASAKPRPLAEASGRSVKMNLVLSAAFLVVAGLVVWGLSRLLRQGGGRAVRPKGGARK